ncbi:MAG TPA: pitrilysin family protein [Thermoanaerobaculia bacterium]|nr:pitrilysin family protein [Thermoanaerobaculia bacterium]
MKRTILTFAIALFTTAAFAQKQAPPPAGTPKAFAVPEIRRVDLPNGMKVRFVPYGSVPKATVRLVVQTGNADEAANEIWLSDLAASLIEQGTATRGPEQIAREVALMGGSLDVRTTTNQIIVESDVFSESAPAAVNLIADVVRNPRFPESELARLKDDLLRNLSIQRSTPQAAAQDRFLSVLYPNHAYGRIFPTEEMLRGFTLEQTRGFYERNVGAARSFVYVVGRFDQAAVESAIRNAFGGWKSGNAPSRVTVTPVAKRAVHFIERPGAVQSTLLIGLPVINPTHNEYLPLTVMNSLLGGSFGSRITSNIREQKGYTYSPQGTIDARLGDAYWAELADVTTNVTGASIKEILFEIERLRSEPPSAAELTGIQNLVAGTFVLRNSSRAGIANQLATLDLHGLSEDYLRTYVQRVYALTPADIQRMAQTYIDPARLAIVVVGDPAVVREQIKTYGEIVQ